MQDLFDKMPKEQVDEFKKSIGMLAGLVQHMLKEAGYSNFLTVNVDFEDEETEPMDVIFQLKSGRSPTELYSEQLSEAVNRIKELEKQLKEKE